MSEAKEQVKDAKIPTPEAAINPQVQGYINASISAAVKEALSGVFASMGPILQSIAVTPEKLREANKPYVDPNVAARNKRETEKSKQDERELRAMDAARRASCPHVDKSGRSSINLIHNFPDRQPRGICVICQDLITPKMWVIDAPDAENPKGRAHLVEAHKNYATVLQLESMA